MLALCDLKGSPQGMMFLNGRLQLLQSALALARRGAVLLVPGKDLDHPKILALLQQVRDHALADRPCVQRPIREQRPERFRQVGDPLAGLRCAPKGHHQMVRIGFE